MNTHYLRFVTTTDDPYWQTSALTTSTTPTALTWTSSVTSNTGTTMVSQSSGSLARQYIVKVPRPSVPSGGPQSGPIKIRDGFESVVEMPDGTVIHVEKDGSYRIDDAKAQVVYRANRVRDFNRYLNASDLLEKFVDYLGTLGVRQTTVLDIPLELFINWLVIEAAKADGDPIPEGVVVENHPALPDTHPKCRSCGRFLSGRLVAAGLEFCSPEHYGAFLNQLENTP